MATSTRKKLIQAAHELFYEDGFHTVGLDRILSDVGVTKTTFYNHFESKDELIMEVLRWHDRWWRDVFTQLLRKHGGDRPADQLLAVFDALEEIFTSSNYNGCFFINVAVNFPLPNDPAHMAAVEHKQAMFDIVRELAGYAGAPDAETFAEELCIVLEGAYVSRQISCDHETSRIGRNLARLLVEKHIPTAAAQSG